MKRLKTGLTVTLLFWFAVAQAQVLNTTRRITPNFPNVDIQVLIDAVSQATGISFIPDSRVRATVNLVNPPPMSPKELYETFLSILQVNGFAVVNTSNPYVKKIVPDTIARQMASIDLPSRVNAGSDEFVTAVIEAKNVNANTLSIVLRPLIPQSAVLQAVAGTNALYISDRASNVVRIQKMIERLDQTRNTDVDMIRLEHAGAADIVRTLSQLTTGQAAEAGGAAPKIVADERTNSVLISGDPVTRLRIAAQVAALDLQLDDSEPLTRHLKYADAEALATQLKQQASGIAVASAGGGAASTATSAAADRSINIWADKPTNTLIITAPPKMVRQLNAIVDELDIPRTQVLIEAFIADVGIDKATDLGVNWAMFSTEDGKEIPLGAFTSPIGSANGSPLSIIDLASAIANPTSITSAPSGATFGVGQLRDNGLNFGVMIRALQSDSNTNVVAMPKQTTLDNEEATLESGQEVPFITGQFSNTGTGGTNGSVNPFTTVQRQQIGTKLKITPKLNGADAMTLTIDLESSELAGALGDAGSAITNVRKFKNKVRVNDGQIIVVGGLIRDTKLTGENRVPFLGRIPVLGNLFKVRNGRRAKTNLMVFIRPTILRDATQVSAATKDNYDLIRDAQQKQKGNAIGDLPIMPFDKPPLLPEMQPVPQPPPASTGNGPATTTPVP
jgi:general secretion pathway protein D